MTDTSTDIMSFFPLPKARKSQEIVIREIDKVFKSGKKIVILEAPVGSGKSAIAMTLSSAYGGAHVITPRKSLQDQYHDDFSDRLVLMKGRNAYPCTIDSAARRYNAVAKSVEAGKSVIPIAQEGSCATGPCRGSMDIYKLCTQDRPCPYSLAIAVAEKAPTIVHNIHSFIFQTSFAKKFEERNLLIVDEAHELEAALREFTIKKITLRQEINPSEFPGHDIKEWENFLLSERFVEKKKEPLKAAPSTPPWEEEPVEGSGAVSVATPEEEDPYYEQVMSVLAALESMGKFVVRIEPILNAVTGKQVATSVEFIPENLSGTANKLLFSFGKKVLLMSGTVYDKDQFCRNAGISTADAHFIRIPSSFPVPNRPIYCKPQYQTDTSHQNWEDNFEEMIGIIRKVMGIFKDVKGLIHAPSYRAADEITRALADPRVVTHDKTNLVTALDSFYRAEGPQVFVSPVCQQGVDFKGDRARFQIITRVPYLNTGDEFVSHKVQNDFSWYNYQALVVFGQQVGRVNRSEDDFGATFLLDSRFNRFLAKNSRKLPKWLLDAVIYR